MKTAHLNNEQFTAYLLDTDSNPATAAHLVACVICREELELFRQSVSSFNSLTLAWSESRAAAQVRRAVPPPRAWFPGLVWAFAACLMLVVALSVALNTHHNEQSISSHPMNAHQHEEHSEAEIARDNQLMTEVNLEINRREQSPVLEYGLSPQTGESAKMRTESRVE